MKKRHTQPEKKLSLKKIQIMKISEMKTINGGSNQLLLNDGSDEPITLVPQNTVSVRN